MPCSNLGVPNSFIFLWAMSQLPVHPQRGQFHWELILFIVGHRVLGEDMPRTTTRAASTTATNKNKENNITTGTSNLEQQQLRISLKVIL